MSDISLEDAFADIVRSGEFIKCSTTLFGGDGWYDNSQKISVKQNNNKIFFAENPDFILRPISFRAFCEGNIYDMFWKACKKTNIDEKTCVDNFDKDKFTTIYDNNLSYVRNKFNQRIHEHIGEIDKQYNENESKKEKEKLLQHYRKNI